VAVRNHWAIQVLPFDADYAMVTRDWRSGFLASYLAGTFTAFGGPLVDALSSSHARLLPAPVRRSPLTLYAWQEREAQWAANGWRVVEPEAANDVLGQIREFTADLDLSPLEPSRTWDISALTDDDRPALDAAESDLLAKLAVAIKECSTECPDW